tara:strand:- start:8267 stop:8650 length:384 start_codon:yes stop_codon:yes gene_type:complete
MKKVIIDTNFILTSLKEKIDFFEELKLMGFQILIPKEVVNELKRIMSSKKKLHFRKDAELALKILEKNKNFFKKINLSDYGKNTDKKIKSFADKNKELVVATLDKKLKEKIRNKKLTIRSKNKLEVI